MTGEDCRRCAPSTTHLPRPTPPACLPRPHTHVFLSYAIAYVLRAQATSDIDSTTAPANADEAPAIAITTPMLMMRRPLHPGPRPPWAPTRHSVAAPARGARSSRVIFDFRLWLGRGGMWWLCWWVLECRGGSHARRCSGFARTFRWHNPLRMVVSGGVNKYVHSIITCRYFMGKSIVMVQMCHE